MFSNDSGSSKRNYRGRGKRAAQEHHSRHAQQKPVLHTSQMRPIRADAVSAANAGMMPTEVKENDPFAPKTSTAEFAAALESHEAIEAEERDAMQAAARNRRAAASSAEAQEEAGADAPAEQDAPENEGAAEISAAGEESRGAEGAAAASAGEGQQTEAGTAAGAEQAGGDASPSAGEPESVSDSGVAAIAEPDPEPELAPESEPAPDPEPASKKHVPAHSAQKGAVVPSATAEPEAVESAAEYERGNARYKHRARFSRSQKVALTIIAVVAVVLCGVGGAALAMWHNAQENIALKDSSIAESLAPKVMHGEPYWVLILCSDKRASESEDTPTRSDVIMLARVDEVSKQVTLVSIPRDTKVMLQGYGTQKINAAYALGGPSLAIQTVSDFAGVDISHYVEVYFKGFRDLVDTIGGVDVDVPEYASYGGVTIQPGMQHLNGKEALTLARNRKTYTTGDFRRTECQRLLVAAVAQKILSQDLTQIPGTIESLSKCFSTDLGLDEVVGLAQVMKGMTGDSFKSAMAPSTTGMIDGASYTFTYINQWKLIMQRVSKGTDPSLDDQETLICGQVSTQTEELDMSVGLPEEVQLELSSYEEEKAKKAAEEETKKQQKGKKSKKGGSSEASSSSSSSSSSSGSNSQED